MTAFQWKITLLSSMGMLMDGYVLTIFSALIMMPKWGLSAVMLDKKAGFGRAAIELADAYSAMSDVEPEVARPHSFWRALLNLFRRSK